MIRGLKRGSRDFRQVYEFLFTKFQSPKAYQLGAHPLCVQPIYAAKSTKLLFIFINPFPKRVKLIRVIYIRSKINHLRTIALSFLKKNKKNNFNSTHFSNLNNSLFLLRIFMFVSGKILFINGSFDFDYFEKVRK